MEISKQRLKYHLAMAGEYLVAAQLQRLQIASSVTYGNAKSADLIAFHPETERAIVIEVKTSSKGRWPIGSRVPPPSSKVWVFVNLGIDITAHPEYFVLTQRQLHKTLADEETAYLERYRLKHGYEYGDRPSVARLLRQQAEPFRDCWSTVIEAVQT